jgi:hypothetical protein
MSNESCWCFLKYIFRSKLNNYLIYVGTSRSADEAWRLVSELQEQLEEAREKIKTLERSKSR